MSKKRVLFVGNGQSAVAWYRCYLPAQALDVDHIGLTGDPPNARYVTGLVTVPGKEQRQSVTPNFGDYDVIVLQQPAGNGWLKFIRALQKEGIEVLFEIDDYLHGIRNTTDHDFRKHFQKPRLAQFETCMRVCDGLIASTDYIARRYRKFNPRAFVCENGLDVGRYKFTKPARETVNIGWAGATAHASAMKPWLIAVRRVMDERPHTKFITIGQEFAKHPIFAGLHERVLSVPWCAIEQYPAAMTLFDIAIGPAGRTAFHAGKSDLRWLEAGALGTAIVADPFVYGKITHMHDGLLLSGFHDSVRDAPHPGDIVEKLLMLVDDAELRMTIGRNAKRYVEEERRIQVTAQQWREPLGLEGDN